MIKILQVVLAVVLLAAYPAFASTEARDADVMYLTGSMFDRGDGVPRDYQEALRWYSLAAEAGQPDAMNSLGVMYSMGHGVSQDFPAAMKWWIKAADGGSIAALSNIATAYYAGLGVRKNYPEAARWFRLAADKGDERALNSLGVMNALGLGVARDRSHAIKLFEQSAYLGCSSAMANLGTLYTVKHDYRLAFAWLSTALSIGVSAEEHDATIYLLGMNAGRLAPSQRARAERLARKISGTIVSRPGTRPEYQPQAGPGALKVTQR
jgi:TPR repeat protein